MPNFVTANVQEPYLTKLLYTLTITLRKPFKQKVLLDDICRIYEAQTIITRVPPLVFFPIATVRHPLRGA